MYLILGTLGFAGFAFNTIAFLLLHVVLKSLTCGGSDFIHMVVEPSVELLVFLRMVELLVFLRMI